MARKFVFSLSVVFTVFALANSASAQSRCGGAKLKATGKKASCVLGAYAKAASSGSGVDSGKVTGCEAKFDAAITKADGSSPCAGSGTTIENRVNTVVNDVNGAVAVSPPSKCQSAKIRAAAKKAKCLLGLESKHLATGKPLDTVKQQACKDKMSASFQKAETGSDCNGASGYQPVEDLIDNFVDDVVAIVNPTNTTTTSTSTPASTTTSTTGICDCCSSNPSLLALTSSGPGGAATGQVNPSQCVLGSNPGTACSDDSACMGGGSCVGPLARSLLYYGGGTNPGRDQSRLIPDLSLSYLKVASCAGGSITLSPTLDTDVPAGCSTPSGTPTWGQRHCTSPGCYVGPPVAIPNASSPGVSACGINRVINQAGAGTGTATCVGDLTIDLPITKDVYIGEGDLFSGSCSAGSPSPGMPCNSNSECSPGTCTADSAIQSCPICYGGMPGACGSGVCKGGARNGLACTPETTALNPGYPTSQDCPPTMSSPSQVNIDTASGTTGTVTKTPVSGLAPNTYCGYCATSSGSNFESPPHTCTSNGQCTTGSFTTCKQRTPGAFANPNATSITETGIPANACITTGTHALTLVNVLCIPPSGSGAIDIVSDIPGPAAVSIPATVQLLP